MSKPKLVRLAGENWRRPGVRIYHEFTHNYDGMIITFNKRGDQVERKQCSSYGEEMTEAEAIAKGGRRCKRCM